MFSKKYVLLAAVFACIGVAVYFIVIRDHQNLTPPIVAITQIAPHPSLDAIRRGITDVLAKANITEGQIIFQNAQGSPATALQIAQKFVSLKPKVIVPITTPSAQAAYGVARSVGIPVIFSAVSEPIAAKLYDSKGPNTLIAGVSDLSPIEDQVVLIKKIFPNIDTIGVVYNAGEANSVALINLFEKEAETLGIKILRATVTGTNSVTTAVSNLVGKVKAIYIPNDNTVIAAFESVLKVTHKYKIAVFTADPESVHKGALASIAHNQYAIGRKTGEMVVQYIKGEKSIEALGVQHALKADLTLNLKTAEIIGVDIPEDTLHNVNYLVKE